ncbi:MAG: hypothetical protein LAT82_03905 [Nanoarchaeota archaeon]|nr:hypothetical protein [Nanoarchaeota archaeon]
MGEIYSNKLPKINEFPTLFHPFYLHKFEKKSKLPKNCNPICLFIGDEFVDGKKSIFKNYLKLNGKKIPDEVHFSTQGLGFLENKKGEFPIEDLDKFRDFKSYFDLTYRKNFKSCDLKYCIIRCKKLNGYMRKTFQSQEGILKYKYNVNKSIIGKDLNNNEIVVYII